MSSGSGLFSGMYPIRRLMSSGWVVDRIAADRHAAGGRGQVAREDAHRRRFSRAVRTEETHDFAPGHREADVVHRSHPGERLHQVGNGDRCRKLVGHGYHGREMLRYSTHPPFGLSLLKCDFARPETLRAAAFVAQKESPLVVHPDDRARVPPSPLEHRRAAAPQDVEAVP